MRLTIECDFLKTNVMLLRFWLHLLYKDKWRFHSKKTWTTSWI